LDPVAGSKVLAYIGHNTCQNYSGLGCIVNGSAGSSFYLYGLATNIRGVCEVMDHTSLAHSKLTTVHEFGHLVGFIDHYGGDGRDTTTQINNRYSTNLFSMDCIYGENNDKSQVISDYTICNGCKALVNGELSE